MMKQLLDQIWYGSSKLYFLLFPFSGLYRLVIALRHALYRWGFKKTTSFSVPIIVVGNLTVGGTGKTPVVIWLANWLQKQGYQPGVVSRGYGGKKTAQPQVVAENSLPETVGDEAVLIVKKTHCPMVVHAKRDMAVKKLLATFPCDIVISDDGLQHYALKRDIEIAVIDGLRRFGNQYCLPAGPLREPKQRITQVDFTMVNEGEMIDANAYQMVLHSTMCYSLVDNSIKKTLNEFQKYTIHAVAGIGHPQRYFKQLAKMGLAIIEHPFPDHYHYRPQDIDFGKNAIVLMTEKDAVKCQSFADQRHWCLPIEAKMEQRFIDALTDKLKSISSKPI